jgi:hypothetical protein
VDKEIFSGPAGAGGTARLGGFSVSIGRFSGLVDFPLGEPFGLSINSGASAQGPPLGFEAGATATASVSFQLFERAGFLNP